MNRTQWIGSTVLALCLGGLAIGVVWWKTSSTEAAAAQSAAQQQEPMELVSDAIALAEQHQSVVGAVGTAVALRSIQLRNEIAGTIVRVALEAGRIAEEGEVLVELDVSVERAELAALEARALLAQKVLERIERASESGGASAIDVERSRADLDVAQAEIARTRAVIERKTIRAPFRARIGLSDVHLGQYLPEGTWLTTLQGEGDALYVDFSVAQTVAAALRPGHEVQLQVSVEDEPVSAKIEAIDSRVDGATRQALVRARFGGELAQRVAPGSALRVRVPVGEPRSAVRIPANALRRGPEGASVYVLANDEDGKLRASLRPVTGGTLLGDDVLVLSGLEAGERVAAAGSFKLRPGVLVSVAGAAPGTDASNDASAAADAH
jgi:membrane fusion protein (multidrug efflux system)